MVCGLSKRLEISILAWTELQTCFKKAYGKKDP